MAFKATKNSPANLAILRANRDKLLGATDWCMMPDAPISEEDRLKVKAYRSLLRNCTTAEPGAVATLPDLETVDLPAKLKASLRAI